MMLFVSGMKRGSMNEWWSMVMKCQGSSGCKGSDDGNVQDEQDSQVHGAKKKKWHESVPISHSCPLDQSQVGQNELEEVDLHFHVYPFVVYRKSRTS